MRDLDNKTPESSEDKNGRNPGDKQIIEKINLGDIEIFRLLYIEYYPSLCIYAKNFTGTRELAEEIVQDVFMGLWERQGSVKINRSIKSYLFVSVRNACLNHLKHLQVVNKFNDSYTKMLKEAQDYYYITRDTGDSHMIARELEDRINEEINRLPDSCKKIFLMSRRENLKHREIAERLGIKINTVHRQVSIAIEKIRKNIGKFLVILLLSISKF